MKVCMFETINMVQVRPGQLMIQGTTKDVPVSPSQVVYIMPAPVPSDVAGPDGKAMTKKGSRIQFSGTALLVSQSPELVLWRLANDLVEVAGTPCPVEVEPELPAKVEGQRLRLVRPDLEETPPESEN